MVRSLSRWFLGVSLAAVLLPGAWKIPAQEKPRPVEFNRDVRPILSDTCFNCHGPDKSKRKAGLHFDTEEAARADLGGYFAIVPGKPEDSAMIKRLTAKDPAKRMPPASAGHAPLKAEQVDLLRRWIAEGAKWQKHWAFLTPKRPPLPLVKKKGWVKNPIDAFVLARLEQAGLSPSPEADRATLLRRVSLDLTGLPPTPAEADAFLADSSPDAYEKVVDRLLRSPRCGERLAQRWLDGARYADTNGYQGDGDRTMWRWRDWVIEAFNNNMPFDRFTIEQIAGDMLPGATLEQKIATGFNRNHRGNSEGGVIPEEYAVEYVVDRVDTTATVWLGLTAGCAKCHSHKYDPISQKEFYQLFAFFNNVPERGRATKFGNSPPYIKAPTREQEVRLKLLQASLKARTEVFASMQTELDRAQARWEQELDKSRLPIDWTLKQGLLSRFTLDGPSGTGSQPLSTEKRFGPGVVGRAVYLDGSDYEDGGDVGAFDLFDKFSISAWVLPTVGKNGAIVSRMSVADRVGGYNTGYNLALYDGRLHVHLVVRWLDDAIRVETQEGLVPGRWQHVLFSYDGSRLASGIKVYIDGRLAHLKVNLDYLNNSFAIKEPFRIGAGGGQESRFHGAIDEVRIYGHVLPPADVGLLANLDPIQAIVAVPPDKRTAAQKHKLRSYYLEQQAPAAIQQAFQSWQKARKELADFDAGLPTTMVMEEMPTPRATHILTRGEYDKKGAKVSPDIPAAFPPLPQGAPTNRLGFARWLVHPANPLTARVAANRYWQMLFGAGIVKTVEDFGAQGDWPSQAELLDWLAVEFMDPIWDVGENCCNQGSWGEVQHWDTRHLLKTIVTSATYRQSSKVTKELLQKDPDNRLLARGPRFRLSADVIRDQALLVSGLLVEKIGGPSVKPYQPPGLVKELHGIEEELRDQRDHGPNLYRRSLYTYWKRTVAPPTLMTFDAANRETCVVRETRTNTPLQALILMNDVTFVEAARMLAQRVLTEAGLSTADRLKLAFRRATGRQPSPRELQFLEAGLSDHLARYRQDPAAALKLVSVGETPRDPNIDLSQLAAFTAVANMILNLDEVITKE